MNWLEDVMHQNILVIVYMYFFMQFPHYKKHSLDADYPIVHLRSENQIKNK